MRPHVNMSTSCGHVNISPCLWLQLLTEVPVGIWTRDKFKLKIDWSVKTPLWWALWGVKNILSHILGTGSCYDVWVLSNFSRSTPVCLYRISPGLYAKLIYENICELNRVNMVPTSWLSIQMEREVWKIQVKLRSGTSCQLWEIANVAKQVSLMLLLRATLM